MFKRKPAPNDSTDLVTINAARLDETEVLPPVLRGAIFSP